jgi:hypothetical protein
LAAEAVAGGHHSFSAESAELVGSVQSSSRANESLDELAGAALAVTSSAPGFPGAATGAVMAEGGSDGSVEGNGTAPERTTRPAATRSVPTMRRVVVNIVSLPDA